MKSIAKMMENGFQLKPIMVQIQNGTIDSKQLSILNAILQNTVWICIHRQNGAKKNKVYLGPDGYKKAVYEKNSKLVKDGITV